MRKEGSVRGEGKESVKMVRGRVSGRVGRGGKVGYDTEG